jgi:hypothetical protein
MNQKGVALLEIGKPVVVSRDGKRIGKVVGTRRCQLAGCTGRCVGVRWSDGKLTRPCSKGMQVRKSGELRII